MTNPKPQLRLRVFAGPNGSGKSTVIQAVRNYRAEDLPIDFGHYVNADDIAQELRTGALNLGSFGVKTVPKEFQAVALASGLVGPRYPEQTFLDSFSLRNNILRLKQPGEIEYLAQIIADFLRAKLLDQRDRFSFETVFSHPSKMDFMRQAALMGYKVYLYFVSTESPEINIFRVQARHAKGGHDVPPETIRSRYYRSLDLLYNAAQLSYQTFFFDNSKDGEDMKMFAHFKQVNGVKVWDPINRRDVPNWFIQYYSAKIGK